MNFFYHLLQFFLEAVSIYKKGSLVGYLLGFSWPLSKDPSKSQTVTKHPISHYEEL